MRKDIKLKTRLESVMTRIKNAAATCNRPADSIRLVAVSKTMPAEVVREAIDAGVTDLGENYIQEAGDKINALATCPVSWHFIGHLQSNKAKYAVRLFDIIHSVDRPKIATAIAAIAPERRPFYFEFSTNEKVATEVAYGAAVNGHLSTVFFKSVGLNVAADTFVQLSLMNIIGGMVVILGDDPGANSSQ